MPPAVSPGPARFALTMGGLLLAATALTACGGDDEESQGRESTPSVSTEKGEGDEDSAVIKTDEGEVALGDDVKLPDAFPDDVALPLGEHKISAVTVNGDEVALVFTGAVEFDLDAEREHIVESLEDEGWTVNDPTTFASGGVSQLMIEATKQSRTLAVVLGNTDNEGTGLYTVSLAP